MPANEVLVRKPAAVYTHRASSVTLWCGPTSTSVSQRSGECVCWQAEARSHPACHCSATHLEEIPPLKHEVFDDSVELTACTWRLKRVSNAQAAAAKATMSAALVMRQVLPEPTSSCSLAATLLSCTGSIQVEMLNQQP